MSNVKRSACPQSIGKIPPVCRQGRLCGDIINYFNIKGGSMKRVLLLILAAAFPVFAQFNAPDLEGFYRGIRINYTANISDSAFITIDIDESTSSIQMIWDLDGVVFGVTNPAPAIMTGTYDDSGFSVQGYSSPYGDMFFTGLANGTITGRFPNVLVEWADSTILDGTYNQDSIHLPYIVYSGGNVFATGVVNVWKDPSTDVEKLLIQYASGLVNPIGLTIDDREWVWIGEQGTGNHNSQVSIITPDGQVHPFLVGLPSAILNGLPIGAEHVYFDIDGKLLIVQGEGSDSLSESILVVDTSGFTPGDTPLGINDIETYYNIGEFSLNQGASTTNPYRIIIGPDNDWFIVDSGLNGIVRRERTTGNLSIFAQWGNIVPTGIAYTGENFYVGSLTGFPFPAGGAKIYEVDLSGNSSSFQGSLTTVTDIAVDPRDNKIVFLQFGLFNNGFRPSTGGVFKINNGVIDTIAYPVNFPTGLCFNTNGDLFVSTFSDGIVYKADFTPTDVTTNEEISVTFQLMQNYPNPFNPSTKISWQLPVSSHVSLKIYDILGSEVATLINENREAGYYETRFNGSALASGMYIYRLTAGNYISTRKMLMIK